MRVFAESVVLLMALAGACFLVGRLLVLVSQTSLFRKGNTESWLVTAFLGTGALTLMFGLGSHAGMPAYGCLILVIGLVSGLALVLWRQKRLREIIPPFSDRMLLIVGVVALGMRAAATLLPLFLGQIYYLFNDTLLYTGAAEWLQYHGFGVPAVLDNPQPMDVAVAELQAMNHRMGPVFLLALLRAVVPFRTGIDLFPVVMAWGATLNVGAVYLLARWALRLPRFPSAVATCLAGAGWTSLTTSVSQGFLCQVYGTATLGFCLALLARVMARRHWTWGTANLLAVALATQLSVYSEMSPLVAMAAVVGLLASAWSRPWSQRGRLGLFSLQVLTSTALVGNVEILRAARAVFFMAGHNGVGRHIDWSASTYARFALGYHPIHIFQDLQFEGWPFEVATGLAAATFLTGLLSLRRRRAFPMATALLLLGLLTVHFAWRARDPWTGELGHTWNLFKLGKWSVVLISTLQGAGLWFLVRPIPGRRLLMGGLLLATVFLCLPHQGNEARRIVDGARGLASPDLTLPALRAARRGLDHRAPPALFLVSAPDGPWPRCLAGYFLYPRPFVNSWTGSVFFEAGPLREPRELVHGTLFFHLGDLPFTPPGKPHDRLPSGLTVLPPDQATIFRFQSANGVESWLPGGVAWIGDDPATLWIFAPTQGEALLTFETRPGPSHPEPGPRILQVHSKGETTDHFLDVSPGATVRIPVNLERGVQSLTIQTTDKPTSQDPHDNRTMYFAMIAARVEMRNVISP